LSFAKPKRSATSSSTVTSQGSESAKVPSKSKTASRYFGSIAPPAYYPDPEVRAGRSSSPRVLLRRARIPLAGHAELVRRRSSRAPMSPEPGSSPLGGQGSLNGGQG